MAIAFMATRLAEDPRMAEAAGETASTDSSLRVRSSSPAIRALIVKATEQSATFRSMVETINASDSVVYVQEGACGRGAQACFMNITPTATHRILWVKVKVNKADSDVMASIGHELRHTIEVLGAPWVTSGATMFMFYTRERAVGIAGRFETIAAVKAGDAVHAEVKAFRRARGK